MSEKEKKSLFRGSFTNRTKGTKDNPLTAYEKQRIQKDKEQKYCPVAFGTAFYDMAAPSGTSWACRGTDAAN